MTARKAKAAEPVQTPEHASDNHTDGVEPIGGLHLRKGFDREGGDSDE